MTNLYSKKLDKAAIFNLAQNAAPIGDVLEQPLVVIGLHHKTVTTGEGEEKLLTMVFVNEGTEKEPDVKSYFSSARSFYNGMEDVANIFGDDIKGNGITLSVKKVTTRNNNTVYTVSL